MFRIEFNKDTKEMYIRFNIIYFITNTQDDLLHAINLVD